MGRRRKNDSSGCGDSDVTREARLSRMRYHRSMVRDELVAGRRNRETQASKAGGVRLETAE